MQTMLDSGVPSLMESVRAMCLKPALNSWSSSRQRFTCHMTSLTISVLPSGMTKRCRLRVMCLLGYSTGCFPRHPPPGEHRRCIHRGSGSRGVAIQQDRVKFTPLPPHGRHDSQSPSSAAEHARLGTLPSATTKRLPRSSRVPGRSPRSLTGHFSIPSRNGLAEHRSDPCRVGVGGLSPQD